jgi:hypothetical protein
MSKHKKKEYGMEVPNPRIESAELRAEHLFWGDFSRPRKKHHS